MAFPPFSPAAQPVLSRIRRAASVACADNAAMGSFFSLLQKNVLDRQQWITRQDLHLAITTWIARTYHRRRRQSRLGKLTPIEYQNNQPDRTHGGLRPRVNKSRGSPCR
jgi:transposase InsO family protein